MVRNMGREASKAVRKRKKQTTRVIQGWLIGGNLM